MDINNSATMEDSRPTCGQEGGPPIMDSNPGLPTCHTMAQAPFSGTMTQQGPYLMQNVDNQEIHILIYTDLADTQKTADCQGAGGTQTPTTCGLGKSLRKGGPENPTANRSGSGRGVTKRGGVAVGALPHRGDAARRNAIISSIKENVIDSRSVMDSVNVLSSRIKEEKKGLTVSFDTGGRGPLISHQPVARQNTLTSSPVPLAGVENFLDIRQPAATEPASLESAGQQRGERTTTDSTSSPTRSTALSTRLRLTAADIASPTAVSTRLRLTAADVASPTVLSTRFSNPMATSTPIAKSRRTLPPTEPLELETIQLQGLDSQPTHTEAVLLPPSHGFPSLSGMLVDAQKHFPSAVNTLGLSAGPWETAIVDNLASSPPAPSLTTETGWHPFSSTTPCLSHSQPTPSSLVTHPNFQTGSSLEQTPDSGLGLSVGLLARTPLMEELELGATTCSSWATSDDSNQMLAEPEPEPEPEPVVAGLESMDENSNSQGEDSEMNRSLTGMVWLKDYALKRPPLSSSTTTSSSSRPRSPEPPVNRRLESRHNRNLCVCHLSDIEVEQDQKPAYKYKTLIEMALQSRPDLTMTSCEIRDWLMANFDFFKRHEKCAFWKNAVRHNLSSNDCFAKDKIKKRHWTLDLNLYRRVDTKETGGYGSTGGGSLNPGGQRPIRSEPMVLKTLGQPMMLTTGLPTAACIPASKQHSNAISMAGKGGPAYQPILPRPAIPSQITLLNVNQLPPSFLCQQPSLVLHIPPPAPPAPAPVPTPTHTQGLAISGPARPPVSMPTLLPKLAARPMEGPSCVKRVSVSVKGEGKQAGRLRRTKSGGGGVCVANGNNICVANNNNVLLQAAVQSGLTGHDMEDSRFSETGGGDSAFTSMDMSSVSVSDVVMDEGQKSLMKRSMSTPAILAKRGKSSGPATLPCHAPSDGAPSKPKVQSRARRKQNFSASRSKSAGACVMTESLESARGGQDIPVSQTVSNHPLSGVSHTVSNHPSSGVSHTVSNHPSSAVPQTPTRRGAGQSQGTSQLCSPQDKSPGLTAKWSPSSSSSLLLDTSTPVGKLRVTMEPLPSPIRSDLPLHPAPVHHPPLDTTPTAADSSLMLDDLSAILYQAGPHTRASPDSERRRGPEPEPEPEPATPEVGDKSSRRRRQDVDLTGLSTPPLSCVKTPRGWSMRSLGDSSPPLDLGVSGLGNLWDLSDDDLSLLGHSPLAGRGVGGGGGGGQPHHGPDGVHAGAEQASHLHSRFYSRLQQVVEVKQGAAERNKSLSRELQFQEVPAAQHAVGQHGLTSAAQQGRNHGGQQAGAVMSSGRGVKDLLTDPHHENKPLLPRVHNVSGSLQQGFSGHSGSSLQGLSGPSHQGLTGQSHQGLSGPSHQGLSGHSGQSHQGLTGQSHQGLSGPSHQGLSGHSGQSHQGLTGQSHQGLSGPSHQGLSGHSGPSHQGLSGPSHQGLSGPSHQGLSGPSHQGLSGPSHQGLSGPSHQGLSGPSHQGLSGPSHQGLSGPSHQGLSGHSGPSHQGLSGPSHQGLSGPSHPGLSGPSHQGLSGPSHQGLSGHSGPSHQGLSGHSGPSHQGLSGPSHQGLSGHSGPSHQGLSGHSGPSHQGLGGHNGQSHQGLSGQNGQSHQGLSGHSFSCPDPTQLASSDQHRQQTHTIPQQTHAIPQQTHAIPQQTHTIPQQTHAIPQQTHAIPQGRQSIVADYNPRAIPRSRQSCPAEYQGQETHTVPQETHAVPQQTHTIPQETHIIPQETGVMPQGRQPCLVEHNQATGAIPDGRQSCPADYCGQEAQPTSQGRESCPTDYHGQKKHTVLQDSHTIPQGGKSSSTDYHGQETYTLPHPIPQNTHSIPQNGRHSCPADYHGQETCTLAQDTRPIPQDAHSIPQDSQSSPTDYQGQEACTLPQEIRPIPQDTHSVPHGRQSCPADYLGHVAHPIPQDTRPIPQNTHAIPQNGRQSCPADYLGLETHSIPQDSCPIPQDTCPIYQDSHPIPEGRQSCPAVYHGHVAHPIPQDTHSIPQDTAPIPQDTGPIPQGRQSCPEVYGHVAHPIPQDTRPIPQNTGPIPEGRQSCPADYGHVAHPIPQNTGPIPEGRQSCPADYGHVAHPIPQNTRPFPQDTRPIPQNTCPIPQGTHPITQGRQSYPAETSLPQGREVKTVHNTRTAGGRPRQWGASRSIFPRSRSDEAERLRAFHQRGCARHNVSTAFAEPAKPLEAWRSWLADADGATHLSAPAQQMPFSQPAELTSGPQLALGGVHQHPLSGQACPSTDSQAGLRPVMKPLSDQDNFKHAFQPLEQRAMTKSPSPRHAQQAEFLHQTGSPDSRQQFAQQAGPSTQADSHQSAAAQRVTVTAQFGRYNSCPALPSLVSQATSSAARTQGSALMRGPGFNPLQARAPPPQNLHSSSLRSPAAARHPGNKQSCGYPSLSPASPRFPGIRPFQFPASLQYSSTPSVQSGVTASHGLPGSQQIQFQGSSPFPSSQLVVVPASRSQPARYGVVSCPSQSQAGGSSQAVVQNRASPSSSVLTRGATPLASSPIMPLVSNSVMPLSSSSIISISSSSIMYVSPSSAMPLSSTSIIPFSNSIMRVSPSSAMPLSSNAIMPLSSSSFMPLSSSPIMHASSSSINPVVRQTVRMAGASPFMRNTHTGLSGGQGQGSHQSSNSTSSQPCLMSSGQPVMVSNPHGQYVQDGSFRQEEGACSADTKRPSMPNFLDLSFDQPSLSDSFCADYSLSLPPAKLSAGAACPLQNRLHTVPEGGGGGGSPLSHVNSSSYQHTNVHSQSASLHDASGFEFVSPQPGTVYSNGVAPNAVGQNGSAVAQNGDAVAPNQHADLHQQLSMLHFDSQHSAWTSHNESSNLSAFFDSLFDTSPAKLSS